MIIGAEVVIIATRSRARVMTIRPNGTLDLVMFRTGERINVKRYEVRWPTADERDKGASAAGQALVAGVFFLVFGALLIFFAAGRHATHVPAPAPAVSAEGGFAKLPDCSWHAQPCVSDDETPGVFAIHYTDRTPEPITVADSWLDESGHRWFGFKVS